MPKDSDFDLLMSEIVSEWNKAEVAIKEAEQLGEETAYPSINELRYAGRKIAEVITLQEQDAPQEEINALISDLRMDIRRAIHDALDASVAIITMRIEIVRGNIPASVIRQVYPEYIDLIHDSQAVHARIQEARENRLQRNQIYKNMHENEFKSLIARYKRFMASEEILLEEAEQEKTSRESERASSRREGRLDGIITGVISSLLGAAILAFVAWAASHFFGNPSPPK